jgi:hypothetical protein
VGLLTSVAADAQPTVWVRGTITAFDSTVLAVPSRDGKGLALQMTDKTTVAAAKAIPLTDLQSGDDVGVTTMKRADSAFVAVEVHTILRTVPAGVIPWDLQPDAMMTNTNVTAVIQTACEQELTLEYTGNTQKSSCRRGHPSARPYPQVPRFCNPVRTCLSQPR